MNKRNVYITGLAIVRVAVGCCYWILIKYEQHDRFDISHRIGSFPLAPVPDSVKDLDRHNCYPKHYSMFTWGVEVTPVLACVKKIVLRRCRFMT